MKFIKTNWLLLLVVLLLGGYQIFNEYRSKSAWIDLNKTYESFQLKKDLENKLVQIGTTQTQILDSLEVEARISARKLKDDSRYKEQFETNRAIYFEKKKQFEQQILELRADYNKQVMNQLRNLIKQYGKENSYREINGMDDSGIFLYGSENEDITEEVITYLNKVYSGRN